jgi:hypothetical protein
MANDKLIELAKSQNTYLEKQYSTQGSKYLYKTQQIHSLNTAIFYLFWIYFIFSLIYLVMIVLEKKYSYQWKIIVFLLLIIYPYLIYTIEVFLAKVYTFCVETIIGNVFQRPDNEFNVDYTFMPLHYVPNIFVPY